jgi:hypothetical protein
VAWDEQVARWCDAERACCASPLHHPVSVVVGGTIVVSTAVIVVGVVVDAAVIVIIAVDYPTTFCADATVRRQHQWV